MQRDYPVDCAYAYFGEVGHSFDAVYLASITYTR